MKISVIIAAYNAATYLSETLDSVLNQTIDDYEVIVINDGSSDQTLEILESYQKKYSNLNIINKENGGPSSARNIGMERAKGDFIYFLDADDLIEPDSLQALYDRAIETNADLVIAKYDIFNGSRKYPVNNINSIVNLDHIERYDPTILWTFSLWNKLFRSSLINQYHFQFPPISYSEDGVFVMRYVYHSDNIVGLNKIILHYRRMYNGDTSSITASVSPWKIKDYITAHKIIFDLAKENILKDYPEYETISQARELNNEIHNYLNTIIQKELQVLINQFYIKFWSLDEESIALIAEEFEEKFNILDMKASLTLIDEHPDLSLYHLATKPEIALKNAFFTAVLYGDESNTEQFLSCLNTLIIQNLIGIKIVLPESVKSIILEHNLMQGNMEFVSAFSENELFHYALDHATTPYITFCDPAIIYTNNAFRFMFKRFIKSPTNFICQLIYHTNYGEPQPVYVNRIALESLRNGIEYNNFLCMDYTLANKFFRVKFLQNYAIPAEDRLLNWIPVFYKKGYTAFYNDAIVLYDANQDTFADFISTEKTRTFIEKYFEEKDITLNSSDILLKRDEAFVKLQMPDMKKISEIIVKKSLAFFRKLNIKNRVAFISIRKDGQLEGNAKALYPYIEGKKVICAKQIPHGILTSIKMYWYAVTSKVIITDDYVRYLRHFPLKDDQRVIQLWHACGAFKKFGQRGTNISIPTDMATHAQYNLVCVSGQYIRPIYADAFNINLKKVRALGCPRTDVFFDAASVQEKKNTIYEKHPEWKNKFIIIYAPTFRDIGNDRTEFHPDLDFDRLSRELLPDQQLLICPHPIMKNAIIDKKYPNIQVVRDFSTNDLMFISDMLITDYSSVIFEYALLKKPIAFFCYDLATYNRGFYLNYPDDLPGPIFENQVSLTEYLRDKSKHIMDDKYELFIQKYMSGCDGHSCERIAKLVNDYMKGR